MPKPGSLARILTLTAAFGLAGALLLPQGAGAAAGASQATGPSLDWTQYLHGPQHSSVSLSTAFTPSNAASARQVWHWQPPAVQGRPAPALDASPTVVAGRVYIGAQSGGFYALNETTGRVAWSRQLDTEAKVTCPARGITSTAAVLPDPVTGTSTVYVSGARFLYALNAGTGAVIWKTEIGPASTSAPNAYYNWSSPTVAGDHIYVGLSSDCDVPLIRGGVVELDQHTGRVLNTWHTVPAGSVGGSIWSSVAASSSGSDLWVATGNECDPTVDTCPAGDQIGNSLSIVHLSSSLGLLQAWQAPGTAGHGHDWDFGSSPTLFGSGGTPSDVGSCNKDGLFYALAANPLGSSTLWTDRIGAPAGSLSSCIASAVWDGPADALHGRRRHHHRRHQLRRIGSPAQPGNRCLQLADRPALRGDGHAHAGQRRGTRRRHIQLRQAQYPGRLPDQCLDSRHPQVPPGRLQPRLRSARLRPGHPVRRHRDSRTLQLRALTSCLGLARAAEA